MIPIDSTGFMLGFGAGAGISALYFAGLAYGMRIALRSASPVRLLSLSAALRIAGLLAVGWGVVTLAGPWAFAGYGAAFFALRFVVTTAARLKSSSGETR